MGKKILIVDDSITVRQALEFTLSKAGFSVIEASDGVLGLKALEENSDIDMLISDISMPNMSGMEMVEIIRSREEYAKLPILMLTTEGGGSIIDKARKFGVKAWMVKPFNPEQIVMAVTKLTG